MKAGTLRHRIEIQAFDSVMDSSGSAVQDQVTGEVIRAWQPMASAWASIAPVSGRDFIAAKAAQSSITARITVRYNADILPAMRVIHGTRIYKIEAVLPDADSGLEYMTLMCSLGATEGAA